MARLFNVDTYQVAWNHASRLFSRERHKSIFFFTFHKAASTLFSKYALTLVKGGDANSFVTNHKSQSLPRMIFKVGRLAQPLAAAATIVLHICGFGRCDEPVFFLRALGEFAY